MLSASLNNISFLLPLLDLNSASWSRFRRVLGDSCLFGRFSVSLVGKENFAFLRHFYQAAVGIKISNIRTLICLLLYLNNIILSKMCVLYGIVLLNLLF